MKMLKAVLTVCLGVIPLMVSGCAGSESSQPAPGSEVTIEMPDGTLVTGRVADREGADSQPEPDHEAVPTETAALAPPASDVVFSASPPPSAESPTPTPDEPALVEITVPAGTTLAVTLESQLASDLSQVEDLVRASVARDVDVNGVVAIPVGSMAQGTVTSAEPAGKVKGRARLAFRFDEVQIDRERHEISTETVSYEAEGTKADDAKKVGIGAGAGALIGGLIGGKKGAGTGAVVGGGAGTAMVLTTGGDEVQLRPGTSVDVTLTQPLVLLVPKG